MLLNNIKDRQQSSLKTRQMFHVPGTQVKRINWSQFKVRHIHIQFADDVTQEKFLMRLGKFQYSWQYWLLSLVIARAASAGQKTSSTCQFRGSKSVEFGVC